MGFIKLFKGKVIISWGEDAKDTDNQKVECSENQLFELIKRDITMPARLPRILDHHWNL